MKTKHEFFKKGKGIRVFSRPERLRKWCKENDIKLDDRLHLITNAGGLVPEFTLGMDKVEFFVHSPFAVRQDENTVEDRNEDSLVFQTTFEIDNVKTKALLLADSTHEVLEQIVDITKAKENKPRLEWDIVKLPHRSYLSIGPKKSTTKTDPVKKVSWLYEEQGQTGAIAVSTSKPIPAKGSDEDDDPQPSHRQAANYYKKMVNNLDGQFIVTMEHPKIKAPKPLVIEIGGNKATLKKTAPTAAFVASVHRCPPQTHGLIHRRPATLAELANMVKPAELDILAELRTRLKKWHLDNKATISYHLLLVIVFPKKRDDDSGVESVDTWAFFLGDSDRASSATGGLRIRDLGIKIGLWDNQDGELGFLLTPDATKRGTDVGLDVLNVSFELTTATAASMNGLKSTNQMTATVIRVGALGSQVLLNLARAGIGKWTVIDHDRLMPHNIARHMLTGHFVGWHKANAITMLGNSLVADVSPFASLLVDFLSPGDRSADVDTAIKDSELVLDMSTSDAVARKLACDVKSKARRISLFLSSLGNDLILLTEDKERNLTLDALEMQYYRAVANNEELIGHLHSPGQSRRYGQSCRDIMSTLP